MRYNPVIKTYQSSVYPARELVSQSISRENIEPLISCMENLCIQFQDVDRFFARELEQEFKERGVEVVLLEKPYARSDDRVEIFLAGRRDSFIGAITHLKKKTEDLSIFANEMNDVIRSFEKNEFKIRCRKKTLTAGSEGLVMGVLNVTPDSFYDGGRFFSIDDALRQAEKMIGEGADIIDIGGESTRPGSKPVSGEEEIRRLAPVVSALTKRFDVPISIDTNKSSVADAMLDLGADMINDISGFTFNDEMPGIAAKHRVPVVVMHTLGRPETMQDDPTYDSIIPDIVRSLRQSIRKGIEHGVDEENIIIDPGIGFGKTVNDNLYIIKHLMEFRSIGRPILIGVSRKSFIGKTLDLDVDERLEGTIASSVVSIMNGANIIRVHDVKEAKRAQRMVDAILHAHTHSKQVG